MTTQAGSQTADFTQQVGNVKKSAGRGSSGASFEQCMNKTVDSEKEQVYEKNKKSDCMDNNPNMNVLKKISVAGVNARNIK